MTRAPGLVVLLASVPLLAACAPAPALPAPMSSAEAEQHVDDANRAWWESMFPDEPMPVVEPIGRRGPGNSAGPPPECLGSARPEVVTVAVNGSWSATVWTPEEQDALNRALFTCSLQYPDDISDPAALGWLSEAEQAWIASYYETRLVPCLRLLGYAMTDRTDRVNGDLWMLYRGMVPVPTSAAEWELIDARCPPSPIGPLWHPPAR